MLGSKTLWKVKQMEVKVGTATRTLYRWWEMEAKKNMRLLRKDVKIQWIKELEM
jgi:hypothetical protein